MAEKRYQHCISIEGSSFRPAQPTQFHQRSSIAAPMASDIGSWGYWRWLDGAAGAIAGGCDGLTDAILLVAEIAATRRLDWRMALENMAAAAQESISEALQPIEIDAGMEEGRW